MKPEDIMATKHTQYIVSAPDDCHVVLGPCRDEAGNVHGSCEWHWTGRRERATRFVGREAAVAFASTATVWMKDNGHDVKLEIRPASGGVPITWEPTPINTRTPDI
jgi:hypothetical protein